MNLQPQGQFYYFYSGKIFDSILHFTFAQVKFLSLFFNNSPSNNFI